MCDPDNLDFESRIPKVLSRLDTEINSRPSSSTSNSKKPTTTTTTTVIFCLQEVSYEWSGRLHAFFANRGYHMITELYGKRFNNYMGVAMAYPLDAFETELVDVVRLSDVREGGWPR